jgi:hypothetical protein
VAHQNGYLYATAGNHCVKLDPDCAVVAEAVLPQDSAYNGLLIAADGRLIMKNIERDAGRLTTLVVLDPDRLEQTGSETPVPENSMGRIATDSSSSTFPAVTTSTGSPTSRRAEILPPTRGGSLGTGPVPTTCRALPGTRAWPAEAAGSLTTATTKPTR